jgi:hypothetical protein
MQLGAYGTCRENQVLSDVHSGYVNVQSKMGVRLMELQLLEDCEDFYSYESPWIPEKDWVRIRGTWFPGADRNIKELAKGTPYTDYRSVKRAITRSGSLMHFYQIGSAWMTAQNSFDFGIQRVIQAQHEKKAKNYFVSVTNCGSGTIAK